MRKQANTTGLTPGKMPMSIIKEKKRIVNNILTAIVIIGAILTFITFIRDLNAKIPNTNTIINGFIILGLAIVLVFGDRLGYENKAWIIIIAFIFIGVKLITINGVGSSTFNFFLFAGLISLLILKTNTAAYIIIFSSLAYILTSSLFAFHILEPALKSVELINIKVKWAGEVCSYLFLLFIVIGGVGRLQRSFVKSIEELDETNQKLNQYNEELRNQLEYSKEMEGKVTEKEDNFRKLFDESNDGIIVCDAQGMIVEANKRIAELLEYPKMHLIGNYSSEFVTGDEKKSIDDMVIAKIHRPRMRELNLITKEGKLIPVEVNYSVIQYNNSNSILVTIRDIQERKQTEQKILNAVIQAEENERSRFAKDLHDDLGPILSSIKLYIQSIRQPDDNADRKELINRLIGTVDDSVKSIRKISYNLSSYLLQNMGLANALKTHVERINVASSFTVNFQHNLGIESRLPSTVEIVIYRIILELINNSTKHSWGNNINIEMIRTDNYLKVKYADDGTGFDVDKILQDNTKGIGLKNVISRVQSVKGILNFDTGKAGFSLSIDIKL